MQQYLIRNKLLLSYIQILKWVYNLNCKLLIMKKILIALLVLCSLCIVSCNDAKIKIEGNITGESCNGQTIYLYYAAPTSDFNSFDLITKTSITNGKFHFDINQEELKSALPSVAYLTMVDINAIRDEDEEKKESNTPVATFILEEGIIRVEMKENSVHLSGTANNEEFNKVHKAIGAIVTFSGKIESDTTSTDISGEEISKESREQFQTLKNQLRDITYQFVKKNMSNHVGEFLFLKSYTDNLFTPRQMLDLINLSSDQFKTKPDVAWLNDILSQIDDKYLDSGEFAIEEHKIVTN